MALSLVDGECGLILIPALTGSVRLAFNPVCSGDSRVVSMSPPLAAGVVVVVAVAGDDVNSCDDFICAGIAIGVPMLLAAGVSILVVLVDILEGESCSIGFVSCETDARTGSMLIDVVVVIVVRAGDNDCGTTIDIGILATVLLVDGGSCSIGFGFCDEVN